jgi:mitochondrial chaperone BCS1
MFHTLHSLLFATTNHIERLDPALSRPGRMDVWINFKNATKWQAEGIFKCFFPAESKPFTPSPQSSIDVLSQENLPGSRQKKKTMIVPPLSEEELDRLAKRFAQAIPGDEFSVSGLNFLDRIGC